MTSSGHTPAAAAQVQSPRRIVTGPALARFDDLLKPQVVVLDNHRSCNAACRMCPTQQKAFPNGRMSDEVFAALTEQLIDLGTDLQFVIFGVHGEPMLDKEIEHRIQTLTSHGITNVRINTNGAALTPNRARKLIEAKTECITISIDGNSAEVYESIRVGLRFRQVVENIERCIEIRNELKSPMHIAIRCIQQSVNHEEIADWKKRWESLLDPDRDWLELVPVHNWAYAATKESDVANPCSDVSTALIVSYDGSVPLCCVDHDAAYDFGNVTKNHLVEIFNNPKFQNVRDVHLHGDRSKLDLCSTCDIPETRAMQDADKAYLLEREKSFGWVRPGSEGVAAIPK